MWNYAFCSEHITMYCQWEENIQNCPFPLDFDTLPEEDPSHGHKQYAQKIGEDRACGSGDMLAERQTHRHTYHNTLPLLPRAK